MVKQQRRDAWERRAEEEQGEASGVKDNRYQSFRSEVVHGFTPTGGRFPPNGGGSDGGGGDDDDFDPPEGFTVRQVLEILHLEKSDHPGMQLVTAHLTGNNFTNWCKSVRRALATRGKLELIDGTFPEPETDVVYYRRWLKVDLMISNWIINSISKEFVNAFTHIESTSKLWRAITLRFGRRNGPKVYRLQREIFKYTQGSQNVLEYFNNLVALWDELDSVLPPIECICKARNQVVAREEQQRLMKFLEGLNEEYQSVSDQIMMIEPLPDIERAYSLIVQVEDRKQLNNSVYDNSGLMSMNAGQFVKNNSGYKSDSYGKPGQFKPRLSKEDKRKLRCSHCQGSGHEVSECFKLHGVPDWYKKLKDNKAQGRANMVETEDDEEQMQDSPVQREVSQDMSKMIQAEIAKYLQAHMQQQSNSKTKADINLVLDSASKATPFEGHYAFSLLPSMGRDVWIVDSGASDHICCDPMLFCTTYRMDKPVNIHLPDGSSKLVTHAGNVRLNKDIVLTDVLSIPGFTHNLLSVARLIQEFGIRCMFYKSHCVFQRDGSDQVLGIGTMKGNLYIMDVVSERYCCSMLNPKDLNLQEWHIAMGHPSLTVMKHMKILDGKLEKQMMDIIERCEVCIRAKQTRGKFPILSRRTNHLFDLVHADLWGPYTEDNLCNTKYMLTLVEDHSRMLWTYMLHSKDQVASTLKTYIMMIKTQFQHDIKGFRTDNGTEFVNQFVHKIFAEHGIIHQRSCPYTPQQNGIVERRHRNLLQTARALMFTSGMPSKFWPYSLLTATWLINRLPSRVVEWFTPYEILFKELPDYSMLRPFGCLAFAVDLSPTRRRGVRSRRPPTWLEDYVCSSFTSQYLEPTTYKEASISQEWVDAMDRELNALNENQTWVLTDLPPGKKPIGCKWVYKVKLNPDGSIERYKARLVAKGFNQKPGIDYTEVFSPVAKMVTVRFLFAVAAAYDWPVAQLDVNNAFLHGFLKDEIYMTAPPGLKGVLPHQVCKLVKSLYGLKQASREWNAEFTKQLIAFGFTQSSSDHCLFIKGSGESFLCLLVYVDDVLVSGPSQLLIDELKAFLHAAFTIKDLGFAKYFLGMEVARGKEGIALNQRKYVLDLISSAGLIGCKPASTPFPSGLVLSRYDGDLLTDPEPYRRLVGQLLYLNLTRPDVTFASQQLSQFVAKPRTSHWKAALHVLRYLKGSPSVGVFYASSCDMQIRAFADADWGTCRDSRRSVTGYCIFFGEGLVSWKCKKQQTVAASTAEAEYRALSLTTRELTWISYLLHDFQVPISLPFPLYCDNLAAIHITKNNVFHEKTKHIEMDCHIVREKYVSGLLTPSPVSSADQLADFLTKSLASPRFNSLLSKMGLLDLHQFHLEGGCRDSSSNDEVDAVMREVHAVLHGDGGEYVVEE